jgi:hypothetical protein
MNESNGYAVFFFPQALEALGEAIKPYLQEGPAGAHVLCNEIDTGGALVEMTLRGRDSEGKELALELMVPTGMVRMVVSTHSDGSFGFGPHVATRPEPAVPPPVADAAPEATAPAAGQEAPKS